MSFSVLPPEIKLKIFEMLDIGSRCNACLVWEEMMKFVPSDPILLGELKEKVTKQNLETAGVLALDGRLDSVDELYLYHVDLKSVHPSIVNSVARKVKTKILLYHVEGLCWSMLKNIKCKSLCLNNTNPALPASTSQNIVDCEDLDELYLSNVDLKSVHPSILNRVAKKVKNKIRLNYGRGLCWSMLENVKCKSLCLVNTVPSLRSSTSQNIVDCEDVTLTGPWGSGWGDDDDVSGLLDVNLCKRLRIHNRKLNDAQTKTLTKMLSNRVEKLGKGLSK